MARVFGPQKGDPAAGGELSAGLEKWARVLTRDLAVTGVDLRLGRGTGASGGLGAGLASLGAALLPRFPVLLDHLGLDERLARADLVVTAEGALDRQTPRGKVLKRRWPGGPSCRGGRCWRWRGRWGRGGEVPGWTRVMASCRGPWSWRRRWSRGAELLTDATERALRMIILGARLPSTQG